MYKKFYSEFLKGHKGKLHFAAHSHHFWPDSARIGHMNYYELAMEKSDKKWDYIFSTLLGDVQKIISDHLNYSRPKDISFAPNTHDLIIKLISSSFNKKKIHILSTTNEFHSVSRQLKRFSELKDKFKITYINPDKSDFKSTLTKVLNESRFDFIISSHVFFNTGKVLENDVIELIIKNKKEAIFILDGYHHYCALPFDLSPFEDDIYYIAGGYKYAQAGEGMCFMTLPKDCHVRPLITGWYAGFNDLEKESSKISFENSGMRFWGSTIDMSAFFRFKSVWDHFKENGITTEKIHNYVRSLQELFIKEIDFKIQLNKYGHFISLELASNELAKEIHKKLEQNLILTDFRGKFIRFGLAPYHSEEDVLTVTKVFNSLKS